MSRWRLGAIERRNPLPVGTYWIDVFGDYQSDAYQGFESWLREHPVNVQVIKKQTFLPRGFGKNISNVQRNWYLFRVTAPVEWKGPGFPTVATEEVKQSGDTVQRPPPATASSMLAEMFSGPDVAMLALVALGIYLLSKN